NVGRFFYPERQMMTRSRSSSDQPKRQGTVAVAVIGALATLLAAIIGAWALLKTSGGDAGSMPSPTCTNKLTITEPSNGQEVRGRNGVVVKGTACDLAGDTGWLFDYDPEDGYHYRVDTPITGNGNW